MFLKRFYFQAKIPSRSGILGSKDQRTLNIHEYATRHKEFYIWQSIVVVVLYLVHYDDTLLQNMSSFSLQNASVISNVKILLLFLTAYWHCC